MTSRAVRCPRCGHSRSVGATMCPKKIVRNGHMKFPLRKDCRLTRPHTHYRCWIGSWSPSGCGHAFVRTHP